MIGLVIVTHGKLAEEFISVMEHVVGPQQQVAAVCTTPDDNMEEKRQEIIRKVKEVDSGKGVLILTDMFGGTPSNLAISLTQDPKIEALAGINLPMLIKLASVRKTETLDQAAQSGQEAGRKYIAAASALLQQQAG
jgi:PTS system mannose-specific IIA component